MPRKMLTRAFLSRGGGGACPQTPLAARTFGARNLPRLVLKSAYGSVADKLQLQGAPEEVSINHVTQRDQNLEFCKVKFRISSAS